MLFTLPLPITYQVIPIACILLYYFIRNKKNNKEYEKIVSIERQIINITNIFMGFLIIMTIFRDNDEAMEMVYLLGMNIMMITLYTALIQLIILVKNKNDYSDIICDPLDYEKIKDNRKKSLYSLIAVTVIFRFSGISYLLRSNTLIIRLIIVIILTSFIQYLHTENIKILKPKIIDETTSIKDKNNSTIFRVLIILLCITTLFTDGKLFEKEKSSEVNANEYIQGLLGEKCEHENHKNLDELLKCLDRNQFIDLEIDKVKKSINKVTIKRGINEIKIVKKSSSKKAEEYCEQNYTNNRRFFVDKYVIIEIFNTPNGLNFDTIANTYLKNDQRIDDITTKFLVDNRKCNHKTHKNMDKLLSCLEDNMLINLEYDKMNKSKNELIITRDSSEIKIVELSSMDEASEYSRVNYSKCKRFFAEKYAIFEIKNSTENFDFDYISEILINR